MSKQTLKLAAIGTGNIWHAAHARNLKAIGGNQVVAVCDVGEDNRRRAAAETGARAYADVAELFERESDLDAVVLCTPPTARLDAIRHAAERGLPVYMEKPPAASLDDARAIADVVARHEQTVGVGFMYRYLPAVDRLRSLIEGRTVMLSQSSFLCGVATARQIPPWFFLKERSGGHIIDQGIHVMDLLRFLVGEIEFVHVLASNLICPKTPEFTVEDSSSANLRFASGATGTHVHSWAHRETCGIVTLLGSDFRLTLEVDARVHGFVEDQRIDEKLSNHPEGTTTHYYAMQVFLDAVRTGDATRIRSPYADAARTLATVLAMEQSLASGEAVRVTDV